MRGIKHLSIEAGRSCTLSHAHSWCPTNAIERDERTITADDAIRVIDEAVAMGFDGYVGFHYYNEPLLYPEFIRSVVAGSSYGRFMLWTNGELIDKDESIIDLFEWVQITDYSDHGIYFAAVARKHPDSGVVYASPSIDERIHNYDGSLRKSAMCSRIDAECAIDNGGGVHLCCEDWNGTIGNVLDEPLSAIWERREPIARELHDGTCTREVCLGCRNGAR